MSNSSAPNLGETVTSFEAPHRDVNTVFLHCSATSNTEIDAETVHHWHTVDNGWSAIGYHFFITSDGVIQYGRDLELTPAAQSGYNTGTIAICANGLVPNDFSPEQLQVVKDLCLDIQKEYNFPLRFRGHTEVAAKSCPVFDYKALLELDAEGHMSDTPAATPAPTYTVDNVERWTIQQGDHGVIVKVAQGLLTARSSVSPGKVDGDAGSKFDASLRAFQESQDLIIDGVCGRSTWEALELI